MASVPLDRPPETPFFDAAAWAACCGVGPAASVVASGETKPLGRFSVSATTWLDSVYVPQHAEKTTENLAVRGARTFARALFFSSLSYSPIPCPPRRRRAPACRRRLAASRAC
jgi:hypothetical protein